MASGANVSAPIPFFHSTEKICVLGQRRKTSSPGTSFVSSSDLSTSPGPSPSPGASPSLTFGPSPRSSPRTSSDLSSGPSYGPGRGLTPGPGHGSLRRRTSQTLAPPPNLPETKLKTLLFHNEVQRPQPKP